jgi:hypothetical protein
LPPNVKVNVVTVLERNCPEDEMRGGRARVIEELFEALKAR